MQESGSLNTLSEFSYNGEKMCMRISASDKNVVVSSYENTLDSVVVFRSDFLELDTVETEYAYEYSIY